MTAGRRAREPGGPSGADGQARIGAGDWNGGRDRVGRNGRGESVWLAWFAAVCADGFADLATRVERDDLEKVWRSRADDLRHAADRAGWDGAWYVRAFDDEGLAWGSKDCDECQIDSIAQSWAVLSGGAPAARAAEAMASATARLVDREVRLVRLLAPPFDRTPRDPGHLCAYPPCAREHGGPSPRAAACLGRAPAAAGVRGGPAVEDGRVSFGAGVFPAAGMCRCGVEGASGDEVWKQPVGAPIRGHLVVSDTRLYATAGRLGCQVYDGIKRLVFSEFVAFFIKFTGLGEFFLLFVQQAEIEKCAWASGIEFFCFT